MPAPKGNKNAIGNKGGRPAEYNPEYCQQMIDYFSIAPYYERGIEHFKDGYVAWVDPKIVPNELPAFHKFATKIGVTHQTLLNWSEKHVEFFDAYTRCKELQKFFLIENGLLGCYNPIFTMFVAKNITDMKDKTETDVNIKEIPKLPDIFIK